MLRDVQMNEPATLDPGRRRLRGLLLEVVETLVLTLVIFVVIQTFVAVPFQINQTSMERTLEPGQYVLVDKLTPRFDPFHRGDIVVFDPPAGYGPEGVPFIKRVVGEPGDTVEVRVDGHVYVNGAAVDEPYLYATAPDQPPDGTFVPGGSQTWAIPAGEVFLLGDHRSVSEDSRVFGPIPIAQVIGRAWLRYWPPDSIGVLSAPTSEHESTAAAS
jgi:signal peptidase I